MELLLGAEVCALIFEEGLRRGDPLAPLAQKTKFGWILSGGCGVGPTGSTRRLLQYTADAELADLVRRFWEQEQESPAPTVLTEEERLCEEIFVTTHQRDNDGRYTVRLPFRASPASLASTRLFAKRMLTVMERKF